MSDFKNEFNYREQYIFKKIQFGVKMSLTNN